MKHLSLRLVGFALAAAGGITARAATYTVGNGSACTHSTIQTAIDAAAVAPDPSTIRITRSVTWSAQALTVPKSTHLITITGGFAACTQSASDGIYTTISGIGASGPVFTIKNGNVNFRYLTISGGSGSSKGGGIRYTDMSGTLSLSDTTIQYNRADYGGGIYIGSSTVVSSPKLVLDQNVLIMSNIADFDGGGIYLDGAQMAMNKPGSTLFGNTAIGQNDNGTGGGYGGGLMIHSNLSPAIADISGGGVPGLLRTVDGNNARFGGGVAITGSPTFFYSSTPSIAELHLHTDDPEYPGAIHGNSARVRGGGIYIRSYEGMPALGNIASAAQLRGVALADNIAPDGAAVFLDRHAQAQGSGVGARLDIDSGTARGLTCSNGDFCSRITGNHGQSPSNPAPIISSNMGTVRIGSPDIGVLVSGNTGAFIGGSNNCQFYVENVQITGNSSLWPIIGGSCQAIEVSDTTVAGNSSNDANVIAINADLVLRRSIIWQPGKTTLGAGIGTRTVADIVTSEAASLNAVNGLFITQADPWFIDPAHGNYGLQAASPAVDYANPIAGDDIDAQGQPRDVDLPIKANVPHPGGPRDLGALERQALLPLVLNADFDFSDLRQWTKFDGAWDATESATGGNGSGSWKFSESGLSQVRVTLGEQCVHLPGPGRYSISGWGKSGGVTLFARDFAILGWEFRRYSTASCNGGAPDRSGELTLGSGTSWSHPAEPAVIEVGNQDWNTSSSIVLRLIGQDGGVTAPPAITVWFDGITMDVTSLSCGGGTDTVFCNGFE